MRDIYRHAASIHVWLGENILDRKGYFRDHAESAVGALMYVTSIKQDDDMDRSSLVELFQLPWFERVWPVQEVVVAKGIDMFWGNQEIKWDLLVSVIHHLTKFCLEMILIPKTDALDTLLPSGYINARSTVAIRDKFRGSQRNTFLEILMDTMRFQASDPRDKIYALLGLGTDNTGHLIEADYSLPVINVYRSTTAILIDASSTLLPFSSAGIGCTRKQLTLPSWVPDYSTDPELLPLSTICSSQDFSACSGNEHSGSFCGNIVELKGRLIDTIDRISQPVSRFTLESQIPDWFRSCLDLASRLSDYPTNEDWKDVLQSVMIPNTYVNREKYDHFMRMEDWNFTLQLVMSPFTSSNDDGLRRLRELAIAPFATWAARRRFFSTSKGSLGLSANGILEDDLVAVVPGSNTPLILRKTRDTHRNQPVYNLVADALINGYMHGEGMSIGSVTDIFIA